MSDIDLMVTLCPSFTHFGRFAKDPRISGIRFNSAQIDNFELEIELEILKKIAPITPVYFDVKGRQLRIKEVHVNPEYLDITLNHAISVNTPVEVILKGGMDFALLDHLEDGGRRLVFSANPEFGVRPGESLHIRDYSLKIFGPMFIPEELEKIEKVKKFGFKKYFLSYVSDQAYVDEFMALVGEDAEVWLKIEDEAGLAYVANEFVKKPNLG